MPDDEMKLLKEVIDALDSQTATLSGEITVLSSDIRTMGESVARNTSKIARMGAYVQGDSLRPGLIARTDSLETSQDEDNRAKIIGQWAWRVAKVLTIPALAVATWVATEAWATRQGVRTNVQEIVVVKTRIDHIEELRGQAETHHRELLQAIEQRSTEQ